MHYKNKCYTLLYQSQHIFGQFTCKKCYQANILVTLSVKKKDASREQVVQKKRSKVTNTAATYKCHHLYECSH